MYIIRTYVYCIEENLAEENLRRYNILKIPFNVGNDVY